MTYSEGHPIRLVGGRLALDFINTADWSSNGQVVEEKIGTEADLTAWLDALDMGGVSFEPTLQELLAYRSELRRLLTGSGDLVALNRDTIAAVERLETGFFDHGRKIQCAKLGREAVQHELLNVGDAGLVHQCPHDF